MWNSKPLFLCHGSKANYGRLNWCDSFFIAKTDFFECGGGEGGGGVCLLFCPNCYLAKFLSINGYYSGSEFRVPNIVKRKQE